MVFNETFHEGLLQADTTNIGKSKTRLIEVGSQHIQLLQPRGSARGERNNLAFLKFINIYALICVYQFILHYLLLSNAVIFGVS